MVSKFEDELSEGTPTHWVTLKKSSKRYSKTQKTSKSFLTPTTPRMKLSDCVLPVPSNEFLGSIQSGFKPLVGKFLSKIPKLKQPSAEWTLAQICLECEEQMTPAQKSKSLKSSKAFCIPMTGLS